MNRLSRFVDARVRHPYIQGMALDPEHHRPSAQEASYSQVLSEFRLIGITLHQMNFRIRYKGLVLMINYRQTPDKRNSNQREKPPKQPLKLLP